MNYFTGLYAQNEVDIPPKSQFIILPTGTYVYINEKKTGFFIEDLLHQIVHIKFNILRDPVCSLVEDEKYYYIVFINDHRLRETIKYNKEELDNESLELILESFKNEFNYFLTVKLDSEKDNISYSMNSSEFEEVNLDELNLQHIRSAIDIINKKVLTQVKSILKLWSIPLLIAIILFTSLYMGYLHLDNYLSTYFKTNITKFELANKKLKEENIRKEREITFKLKKLKKFNSKKDILQNDPQKIYNILSNTI